MLFGLKGRFLALHALWHQSPITNIKQTPETFQRVSTIVCPQPFFLKNQSNFSFPNPHPLALAIVLFPLPENSQSMVSFRLGSQGACPVGRAIQTIEADGRKLRSAGGGRRPHVKGRHQEAR